jgi:hypothetical protein
VISSQNQMTKPKMSSIDQSRCSSG